MRAFSGFVAVVALAWPAMADVLTPFDLADGAAAPYGLIEPGEISFDQSVLGDTYSVAPLVQTATQAFLLHARYVGTFNGTDETSGTNAATTRPMRLRESQTTLPNGNLLVRTELTSINASGNPERWVPAGVTGPGGAIFTAWRMDVGTNGAGAPDNRINPDNAYTLVASGFTAFNSAGTALGSFALSLDSSDPSGVSGVALVGLGGANIAGFDMATIQMFWEIDVVPEPAGLGLLALGALLASRRR